MDLIRFFILKSSNYIHDSNFCKFYIVIVYKSHLILNLLKININPLPFIDILKKIHFM